MDEAIGRLVVGVDRAAAETGVGIILDFLVKEGPADKMRLLLAKLRQFIAYARAKVGEDEVGKIVGAIPGLAQFV